MHTNRESIKTILTFIYHAKTRWSVRYCVCVFPFKCQGVPRKQSECFRITKKVLRNTHHLTRTNYIKYRISHLYSPPSLFNVALSRCGRNTQKSTVAFSTFRVSGYDIQFLSDIYSEEKETSLAL